MSRVSACITQNVLTVMCAVVLGTQINDSGCAIVETIRWTCLCSNWRAVPLIKWLTLPRVKHYWSNRSNVISLVGWTVHRCLNVEKWSSIKESWRSNRLPCGLALHRVLSAVKHFKLKSWNFMGCSQINQYRWHSVAPSNYSTVSIFLYMFLLPTLSPAS